MPHVNQKTTIEKENLCPNIVSALHFKSGVKIHVAKSLVFFQSNSCFGVIEIEVTKNCEQKKHRHKNSGNHSKKTAHSKN